VLFRSGSEEIMKNFHDVSGIGFDAESLFINIDENNLTFKLKEVSPSGYGIHWPLLDGDISIDGLFGIAHVPKREEKTA
jgi:hypothetical protein